MVKIFIFGKSATNFAEIIQSSLNVNINCCDNSELFICNGVCYKRLLQFQRVAEDLQEAKKEIEEAFRAREKARAKRLLRSEDGKPEEAPLLVSRGNPKSLRFGTEASTSTTVILQVLTVSPCLMLQGLSCAFVVCYRQLKIIRIISC